MNKTPLTILHTSDWHIGHVLCDRKRDEEFASFFNWLCGLIESAGVKYLLVAGDVFDTSTPGHRAQQIYYDFLQRVKGAGCRHIVVTAGNHDSAILLEMPAKLLKPMNIHVLGLPDVEDPSKEVLVLDDEEGRPELVVCAVPYLRDNFVRLSAPGETPREKEMNFFMGIASHYRQIAEIAQKTAHGFDRPLPIVAMGHLFVGGGSAIESEESERSLYVGNLGQVSPKIFAENFDYVALGHLHAAQNVAGMTTIRYSGAPLPMGFDEARRPQSVTLLQFVDGKPQIREEPVPRFRHLEVVEGEWAVIEKRINELKKREPGIGIWLKVVHTGSQVVPDLKEKIENMIENEAIELLRLQIDRSVDTIYGKMGRNVELADLDVEDVFRRRLADVNLAPEQCESLLKIFNGVREKLFNPENL